MAEMELADAASVESAGSIGMNSIGVGSIGLNDIGVEDDTGAEDWVSHATQAAGNARPLRPPSLSKADLSCGFVE